MDPINKKIKLDLFNEKLIKAVKPHECLYNLKCPNYRRVDKKEEIWKKIGEKLGMDVIDCKSRWKCIRDRYRNEMAPSKRNKTKYGNGKDKPSWKFIDMLEFLGNADCQRKTLFNYDWENAVNFNVSEEEFTVDSTMLSNDDLKEDLLNETNTENDFKPFREQTITSLTIPTVSKTFLAKFMLNVADQIDALNLPTQKVIKFQQNVLQLVYDSTKQDDTFSQN